MGSEGEVVEVGVGNMAASHGPGTFVLGQLAEERRNGHELGRGSFGGARVPEDSGDADEPFLRAALGLCEDGVGELKLRRDVLDLLEDLDLGQVLERLLRVQVPEVLQLEDVEVRVAGAHYFGELHEVEPEVDLAQELLVELLLLDGLEEVLLVQLGQPLLGRLEVLDRVRIFAVDDKLAEHALHNEVVGLRLGDVPQYDVGIDDFTLCHVLSHLECLHKFVGGILDVFDYVSQFLADLHSCCEDLLDENGRGLFSIGHVGVVVGSGKSVLGSQVVRPLEQVDREEVGPDNRGDFDDVSLILPCDEERNVGNNPFEQFLQEKHREQDGHDGDEASGEHARYQGDESHKILINMLDLFSLLYEASDPTWFHWLDSMVC